VGFADRLLLSKTDLVEPATVQALRERLARINGRAALHVVEQGRIDLGALLDVRGFNLNPDLGANLKPTLRPVLKPATPDRIATLVLRTDKALDIDRLSDFMNGLLETHGTQLLRYKGVLNIAGEGRKLVFQGVLKLYGFDWDAEWAEAEPRESVMVFIADDLPEATIRAGFEALTAE